MLESTFIRTAGIRSVLLFESFVTAGPRRLNTVRRTEDLHQVVRVLRVAMRGTVLDSAKR